MSFFNQNSIQKIGEKIKVLNVQLFQAKKWKRDFQLNFCIRHLIKDY